MKQFAFSIFLSFVLLPVSADSGTSAWKLFRHPTLGPSEIHGRANSGCLSGAIELPLSGDGFEIMKPSRRRNFAHSFSVGFIEELGGFAQEKGFGSVLVGNIAAPRGGPTLEHASHQTGLDLDIRYNFLPQEKAGKLTIMERDAYEAAILTTRKSPLGKFVQPANWETVVEMLKFVAESPAVSRVLVHPSIKKQLCRQIPPEQRGWLRRILPECGHHDHFHTRLFCPPDSVVAGGCVPQAELTEGDGCDRLAKWFSKEKESECSSGSPKMPTDLPARCTEQVQKIPDLP